MATLQQTTTRWSKSFPTIVSTSLSQYTCSYERGKKSCKKTFARNCDLRLVLRSFLFLSTRSSFLSRHQANHIRPSKCKQCNKGFPSPKDVERHVNSVHNNTIKYFCPHDYCRDALKPQKEDWVQWGFRRKDHWLKHLRTEHNATRQEIRDLQTNGIPMAVLKKGLWDVIMPRNVLSVVLEVPSQD